MAAKHDINNTKPLPSKDDLNAIFEYKDGMLFWKTKAKRSPINIGDRAGSPLAGGYRRICIKYGEYREHRIIFMMHHGYCPNLIDHIDRDTQNNRIENLRALSGTHNQYNRGAPSNNKSGVKGVFLCKKTNKWATYIGHLDKRIWLGYFDKKEDAADAYQHKFNEISRGV
jgi:hypothetical protein